MNNQKSLFYIFLSLISLIYISSCTNNSTSPEVNEDEIEVSSVISYTNSGAQAYLVTNIDGPGASTELDSENPTVTLEKGNRYTFINNAGASSHPLDFRNENGDKLLGQSNNAGMFDDNESVNVVRSGDSITFTLTDELAEELVEYICAFHPGMNGSFTIN